MEQHRLFIDGRFVASHGGGRRNLVDPATQEPIATVADADARDVDLAVSAARRAFDGPWRTTSGRDRGAILGAIAKAIRERADELSELETRNSGKPIVEAESDVEDSAACFEHYAAMAATFHGETLPSGSDALMLALPEPVGVAAQIIPWNYPLMMAAWKIAPALAAGCTVVLKPSEETPLSILALAEDFSEAGVPDGVVNIVTGTGETVGAALVDHEDVDKLAFTGSGDVGRRVMAAAARTLKRVSLELGGKSPAIVFADADFEAALQGALFGVFLNQGEMCSATSRILVERAIYPRMLDALVERARTIRLGPGLDRATRMGPLVSERHFMRVRDYQELGKREASLALGGGRATGGALDAGFFVQPTIFRDVDPGARIAREEIFGPVACVTPFDDEDEAVRIANQSPFGLAAAVWTRDVFRAFRCVKRLRAGVVWVNHSQPAPIQAPWGGFKQSGIGRELGRWGLESYLEMKQAYVNLDENPVGWP